MPRLRKVFFEYMPLAVAISVLMYVTFMFVRHNYVQRALPQEPNISESPLIKGMAYRTALPGGGHLTLWAEKMSVRNQHLDEAVFALFKEIVLSGVRVSIQGRDSSEILDWANSENLALLAALMVSDLLQQDGLYLAGSNMVLEDVEVNLYQGDEQDWAAWFFADTVTIAAISDKVVFTGRIDLRITPSDHISSNGGGIWAPAEGTLRFPNGYSHNDESKRSGSFALITSGKRNTEISQNRHVSALGWGGFRQSNTVLSDGQVETDSLRPDKKTHLHIRHLKRPEVQRFAWQFLALNPDIFQREGVTPFQLLMPNFRIGAFDPGPCFGSTESN